MYISTIVGIWYCVLIKCELHIIPFGDENVKFLFLGGCSHFDYITSRPQETVYVIKSKTGERYLEELKSKVYLLKHRYFERYRTHCTESTIILLKTSEGRKEWNGYRNIEIFKVEAPYRVQVKSWCLADEIIIF